MLCKHNNTALFIASFVSHLSLKLKRLRKMLWTVKSNQTNGWVFINTHTHRQTDRHTDRGIILTRAAGGTKTSCFLTDWFTLWPQISQEWTCCWSTGVCKMKSFHNYRLWGTISQFVVRVNSASASITFSGSCFDMEKCETVALLMWTNLILIWKIVSPLSKPSTLLAVEDPSAACFLL